MVDQFIDRLWADDRARFADGIDDVGAKLQSLFARFSSWDGSTHQLIALIAAFLITTLNFNATAV